MRQTNSSIQEIKDRLNIVDVLSSYIQLKKAGTNYKANCPFHNEKSASLMVSPSKQIWHCFGCGEGGDIFGFVMKYENMDFGEALHLLADRAGVVLPKFTQENSKEEQYKDVLYKVNELAARYYHQILKKSSTAATAAKYLINRGLKPETLEEWMIGFAPNEFHLLENFLLKKHYKYSEMMDAGVLSKNSKGEYYDRFFNRVTFPIRNYAGEVVGFTARVLDADAKAAKYVNSPETQIYNKSKVIFGLYQAKQAIRKQDFAIVVEGNMDVISAHQAGFKNVVASSGTAFTYDQLQTLSRLTKNLKFAFDTDAAGATATRRTVDLALQLGFTIYIVKIQGAKDPDELIKKDPKLFAQAVEDAPLYLDYYFEKSFENYDPTSVQQKKVIAANLLPLLRKLNDLLEAEHYIHTLAQRLNVTEKTLYEVMAKDKNKVDRRKYEVGARSRSQNDEQKAQEKPLLKPRSFQLEQRLLGYVLFRPEYSKEVRQNVALEDFHDQEIRQILQDYWQATDQAGQQASGLVDTDKFVDGLSNSQLAKIALFMVESEYHQLDNSAVFENEFRKLLKEFVSNNTKIAMNAVMAEIALAEQKKDKQKVAELNKKFIDLSKRLN